MKHEQNADIIIDRLQLGRLNEIIFAQLGMDCTGYSATFVRRRITTAVSQAGLKNMDEFCRLVEDSNYFCAKFIKSLTVPVTTMFRDPSVFLYLRQVLLPQLGLQQKRLKFWCAGACNGAEAYALAIVLLELGLAQRSRIYVTDFNPDYVDLASRGGFAMSDIPDFTHQYIASGGRQEFSSYFRASHHLAHFDPGLKRQMVFSVHNLVTDGCFSEFDLILCRNVMIYFAAPTTQATLSLMQRSLVPNGYLCVGKNEPMWSFDPLQRFNVHSRDHGLYCNSNGALNE